MLPKHVRYQAALLPDKEPRRLNAGGMREQDPRLLPDWSHLDFHPVVVYPVDPVVLDLSAEGLAAGHPDTPWAIGRYDEDRGIYTQELFAGQRTVHMGVDLGGPVGVAVHAFWAGTVVYAGYNAADGDYGHTLVTRHDVEGTELFALWGHLSAATLAHSPVGRSLAAGEVLGWLGDHDENGGWPPHLHLQLAWEDPGKHDMPGAVSRDERARGRARFPDPRLVLGPVHP